MKANRQASNIIDYFLKATLAWSVKFHNSFARFIIYLSSLHYRYWDLSVHSYHGWRSNVKGASQPQEDKESVL